jgi:hypothetical protein
MYHHSTLQGIHQGNPSSGIEKIAKNNDLSKIKMIPEVKPVEPVRSVWPAHTLFLTGLTGTTGLTDQTKQKNPPQACRVGRLF